MRMLVLLVATWAACGDGASPDLDGASTVDLATAGPHDAAVGPGADLAMPPVVGEPASLTGITAAHNVVRMNAMPTPSPALSPYTWSSSLAADAQTWANGCMFQHSSNGHGENIYASAGSTPTGQAVVDNWAGEAGNYNYAANSCTGTCGHYTQIVWRDTTTLGCGMKACSTNSPFMGASSWTLVVCDYDPPGNSGGRPY